MQKAKIWAIVTAAMAIIILILSGLTYYYFDQVRQLKLAQQQVQPIAASDEIKALIEKVGALMVLPTGEEPVVATVTDPEKLKGQAIFNQAKKGDRVLIYAKAQKAILYDPVANKIVEVASLSFGNPAPVAPTNP